MSAREPFRRIASLRISAALGWAVGAAAILFPSRALAADCPAGSNTVYISGSSASQPFVAALSRTLAGGNPAMTPVYVKKGSCTGVDGVLNGTALDGSSALYWANTTDTGTTCTIPTGGTSSTLADIGVSDVFAESCFPLPNGLPAAVGEFDGPVQTMTFIVPTGSTQTSISATAAYFVWGFGSASGVAPWENPAVLFRRNNQSGTQQMISAGIGVNASLWKGIDTGGSSGVLSGVTGVNDPDLVQQTIGIVALTDVSDTLLPQIKVLAYKHYDQQCGYYPNSSATSKDLDNVRDGHYALWGPMHFFTRIDANGYPVNKLAGTVINYLTGASPPPAGLDLIQVEAVNNLIPSCAMHVKRTSEVGPLQSFAPNNSCSCYYDVQRTGSTTCQACSVSSACPATAPVCSFGYCETQ